MGTETPLSESHSASAARTVGQSVEERGETFVEGRKSIKTRQGKPPLFLEADSWPFTSLGQCGRFTEPQEQVGKESTRVRLWDDVSSADV